MAVVISFKSHVMLADSLAGDVDVKLKGRRGSDRSHCGDTA
jgi:hypothetical protein